MLKRETLDFILQRLKRVDDTDCAAACRLVENTLGALSDVQGDWKEECLLFQGIWEHLTRALDHAAYPGEFRIELEAMEAEMGGRVMLLQLAHGLLKQARDSSARYLH